MIHICKISKSTYRDCKKVGKISNRIPKPLHMCTSKIAKAFTYNVWYTQYVLISLSPDVHIQVSKRIP